MRDKRDLKLKKREKRRRSQRKKNKKLKNKRMGVGKVYNFIIFIQFIETP
jgi:hypothetical protein